MDYPVYGADYSGPTRYAAAARPPVGSERGLPGSRAVELLSHTYTPGYKDVLAAAGLEFHTEMFDLAVDPIAQGGIAIAVGATAIATVRIGQEADFVAEKIVADHVPFAEPYVVQIFDNATNRALSNIPIRNDNLVGTGERPRIIKPRLFRRNSDLSFVFTNVGVNPITVLQLVLCGYKIFDPCSLNLNRPQ